MNITRENNRDRSMDKNLQDDWIPDQRREVEIGDNHVTNYMDHNPICVMGSTRIGEVKYLLSKYELEELVVVDESHHPIGIVGFDDVETDEIENRDIPSDVSAMECMRLIPSVIMNNSSLEESMNIMRLNNLKSILVVDGNGRLEGIINKDTITKIIM